MMSIEPDWANWQAFDAALETGSLAAAARRLRLSQATVRARIEALERALQTVLFIRTPAGLRPTDQAAAMAGQLAAMRSTARAMMRTASAGPGEASGIVRISTSEFVGTIVLPAMLVRLRARHPDLSVALAPDNAALDLNAQEADIALRMHRPSGDDLVARKVGAIRLGFYASRDYVDRRGRPASGEALLSHDLIGPDRSSYDRTLAAKFLPALDDARYVLRTDNHASVLMAVRAGLGIGVVQRSVGDADPTLVPILPERDFARLEMFVVAHRSLRSSQRVGAVYDWLVDEFNR